MSVALQCIGFDCASFLTWPSSEGIDQGSSKRVVENIRNEIAKLWGSESITFGQPLDEALTSLLEVYKECSGADWADICNNR
jgi:hypothetical protein